MPDQRDRPGAHHVPEPAWEPTNLIVPWPADQPPQCSLLGRVVEDAPTDDPRVLWSHAVEVDDVGIAVLWAEPARAIGDDLDVAARDCPWVLGIEMVLDHADPLASLVSWMGVLMDRVPKAPGVIDVNTSTWHPRAELLGQLAADAIEAPADLLWITHVVQAPDHGAWLHTHGLRRCGRPELDMLDVPDHALETAAELMSHAADLMLEQQEIPALGRTLAIGHDLEVVLRPWEEIADALEPGAPGGPDDRTDPVHGGARAVLCETGGPSGSVYPWPRRAVARVESGDAALFMTARATRRQTGAAQRTWDDFLAALGAPAAPETEFLIKVALGTAQAGDMREHVWCRARRHDGERVDVELVNRPVTVPVDPSGRMSVGRDDVTDWRVVTPDRTFAPETAAALARICEAGT